MDFVFNACYVRALRGKDAATAERLRGAYLDFTVGATEFAERISPRIFGREVTNPSVMRLLSAEVVYHACPLSQMSQTVAAHEA